MEEKNKKYLMSLISKNRLPNSIIIELREGIERDEIIDFISKAVVCSSEKKPCNSCNNCQKVDANSHPDVIRLNYENNSINVSLIREMRKDVFVVPNEAEKKIYVLNNADNMTVQAQNAILKILEEPPSYVVFLIVVESTFSLLSTVKSRSIIFSFNVQEKKSDSLTLSQEIFDNIILPNEMNMLLITSKLMKDKQLIKEVIDDLIEIFRKAYCNSIHGDSSSNIAKRFTLKKILSVIDILEQSGKYLKQNVNITLFITFLFSNIKKALYAN